MKPNTFINVVTKHDRPAFIRPDSIVAIVKALPNQADLNEEDHRSYYDVLLSGGQKVVINPEQVRILVEKLDLFVLELQPDDEPEADAEAA